MKSRRIWIWAVLFGFLASITLYIAVFSQQDDTVNDQQANVEEQEIEVEEEESEEDQSEEVMDASSEEDEVYRQEMLPIEEGKRAMSIDVNYVEGVSGFIEPGDYVDLVTIINTPEDVEGDQHDAATLLLQKVRVLAIGHATHSPEEAANYQQVTLEVEPYEGLSLGFATKWDLYLMLRDQDDESIEPDRTHVHEDDLHEGVFR
ncbi:pilus assembly protein CpaB [Alkalibacillus filiformis]|uniref:Pilus assembly protein CpaB n=1 Tax=Alkalibacillus filiformis TaxID=200990 RepID=A0ABU0DQY5_9BACI|nr:Flp pilus assembly protein CpaB [Alkalibacillus filiformis]MDQ0350780.1 pilus assembly protein CpaB [Alkalibacillus filiformis]